jgi:hypothetical protein
VLPSLTMAPALFRRGMEIIVESVGAALEE